MIITATATAAVAAGAVIYGERRRRTALREKIQRQANASMRASEELSELDSQSIQARAEALRGRLERQVSRREKELKDDEERLARKRQSVERRESNAKSRDADLAERFAAITEKRDELAALRTEIDQLEQKFVDDLERSAGDTTANVLEDLSEDLEEASLLAARKAAAAYEQQYAERSEQEARRLMQLAIQRYGSAQPANRLISTVALPESAKLRDAILSDGAAVLHAIYEFSDVEFIDRGEGNYYLQAPDPFTREVGRLAFQRMVRAGRVDVGLTQGVVEKARKDLDKIAHDAGRRAARLLKVKKMHPEILYLVGKLLYRTSYTQNQWQHAIETAHLCGIMAEEMGLDIRDAQRSGLIHDIGKVLWAETEAVGSHAVSGAVFAREHGEVPEIVHPVMAHHNDERPSTPLAHLVAAADALSGARPGARRETLESYTKRVDEIEAIVNRFKGRGIQRCYVIQGGREVRVEANPRKVDDHAAARLSSDIAMTIEEECVYPGQIKVIVMREIVASSTARG